MLYPLSYEGAPACYRPAPPLGPPGAVPGASPACLSAPRHPIAHNGRVTAHPFAADAQHAVAADRAGGRTPHLDAVVEMLAEVERTRFPLDLPGTPELRALRDAVRTQLGTRLIPRLRQATAPAVVVLGGASGSGKSTLLNSALGTEVSATGILRPTTRHPVLVVHPDDAAAFTEHPLAQASEVVTSTAVPAGLAVLDTPDLDSVRNDPGTLGAQLLEVADLWIFVTTASRYGDALPWRVLTDAKERGVTTAVVLNRVPARVRAQVRQDLLARMDALGLGSAPLFLVADAGPHEGLLPADQLAELVAWLRLVADRRQSPALVARTTRGVWAALRTQLLDLAAGADLQTDAVAELRARAEHAAAAAADDLVTALEAGKAGLGAPTTRWLAVASTGGPLATLVSGRAPRRGWGGRALATRTAAAQELGLETDAAVQVLVGDAVRAATEAVRRAWAAPELGAAAVLDAVTADPVAVAARVLARWRDDVEALVTPVAAQAATTFDAAGLAAVIRSAAAGVTGAARAVPELLGPDGREVVVRARDALVTEARAAVHDAAAPAVLDGLGTEPGTALRVRATELREP